MNKGLIKISTIIKEISMGPFGSDIKIENFVSNGVPVLNGSNLMGIKLVDKGFKYVTTEKAKTFRKAIAKRGDIVITHRGTLGQISYIPEESKYDEYVISQSQFRVALDKSLVDSAYLVYYFHTSEGQRRLLANKCHVGVPALAQATTNFRLIEIPLPTLSTQQKIAFILSSLDSKIELNNRINAELEAMAKTLYDYWFVQFDFPDANGKPYKSSGGAMVWNDELKREIPEEWSSVVIENLLSKDFDSKKIPASEYLHDGKYPIVDQSTDFIAGYTNDLSLIINVTNPRIVFGDHTRIVKFINFDFARGADGTQVVLSNNNRMPQHLFYHTILKIDLSNYGYARHYKFLKERRIILPVENISKKFETKVEVFYNLIQQNRLQNKQLSSIRDWLLPMLMNGQVRVK